MTETGSIKQSNVGETRAIKLGFPKNCVLENSVRGKKNSENVTTFSKLQLLSFALNAELAAASHFVVISLLPVSGPNELGRIVDHKPAASNADLENTFLPPICSKCLYPQSAGPAPPSTARR
jgi:hypothetical protein